MSTNTAAHQGEAAAWDARRRAQRALDALHRAIAGKPQRLGDHNALLHAAELLALALAVVQAAPQPRPEDMPDSSLFDFIAAYGDGGQNREAIARFHAWQAASQAQQARGAIVFDDSENAEGGRNEYGR